MTMAYSAGRRRPARRWILVPALVCLGATLVFATPIRIGGLSLPEPVFPLAAAFGWAALRPSVTAPAALVGLGLVLDALWGAPFGLWPTCLLLAHGFTLSLRRVLAAEDAPVLWLWYALACALAFAAGEGIVRLLSGVWPNLFGMGLQWAVTALLFPLAGWMMERYQARAANTP